MKNRILVIGLGNILLRDEGVGVHVIGALRKGSPLPPWVDVVDGGTLGLDLLPLLEDRDKILIVDATDFGREAGYVGEIEGDDLSLAFQRKYSVHHLGLADLLLAATWAGMRPSEVYLVGIQPESVEAGLEMTDLVKGKIEELMERVVRKINAWNINCAALTTESPETQRSR